MKKIIIVIFSLVFLSNNVVANDFKINTYGGRSEIPEDANPNEETLKYFLNKYLKGNWNNNPKYTNIKASENPYKFESN